MTKAVLRPFLTTRELYPENQETPIHVTSLVHIPDHLFFRRNHFPYPSVHAQTMHLEIFGKVHRPHIFHITSLRSMRSRSIQTVLECAGNKRSFFEPKTFGEQWEKGAVGQGVWTGVPLCDLLRLTGLKAGATEVVVEGWDMGQRPDMPGTFPYARSLPINKAMHPDTIIAYEHNGQPITIRHGFPFRLIVPGWYAMASVKWVRRIIVIDDAFQGPFQSVDYQYYPHSESDEGKYPVMVVNVNSSIQRPIDRSVQPKGKLTIRGIAWTGLGQIKQLQLSFDHGHTWVTANLWRYANQPYSWVHWYYELEINRAGEYIIMSRAEDTFGRMQPLVAQWNRKGYGYHAADRINVKVE